MIQEYAFQHAPNFARASSTFQKDERCVEVDCIVGDDHDEVYSTTRVAHDTLAKSTDKVTDYDINWSREGEKWVGVTCVDK